MLVYLAGAIDLVPPEFQNWKKNVKAELQKNGITTLDPSGTFVYASSDQKNDAKQTAKKLMAINEHNLLMCDLAIILMSKTTPSIGTPIELYLAHKHNIPHVVIYDHQDHVPVYLLGLSNIIVFNTKDAVDWVIKCHKNPAVESFEY